MDSHGDASSAGLHKNNNTFRPNPSLKVLELIYPDSESLMSVPGVGPSLALSEHFRERKIRFSISGSTPPSSVQNITGKSSRPELSLLAYHFYDCHRCQRPGKVAPDSSVSQPYLAGDKANSSKCSSLTLRASRRIPRCMADHPLRPPSGASR